MSDTPPPTDSSHKAGHGLVTTSFSPLPDLSPEEVRELERACDAFQKAYQAGNATSIEAALTDIPEALRSTALRQMVAMEVVRRRQAGERPDAAEYLARFPELDPRWLAAVAADIDTRARTQSVGNVLTNTALRSGIVAPALPGYEILGEIARGAMGVVYKARQFSLDRLVAVKMLLRVCDADDSSEDVRFLTEAEAMAAVAHPNVVQVYDFGRCDDRPYLVLEYLAAGTLTTRLKAGRLGADEAAHLLEKLARGVHAAHVAGIVHRDLKPGNVLFDAAGNPKVSDFGLARRESLPHLTATGAILGTPAYMAPEQARGDNKGIGPASDIWALGGILYECLSGRRPFDATSTTQLLAQIANEEPPPLRQLVPSIPRELETIVAKCLCKNRADRYASALDLAEDLRRFREREPILARRASVLVRLAGVIRRSDEDTQFARTAILFFWLAPLVLATEVAVTAVRFIEPDDPFLWVRGLRVARLVAVVLLVLVFRRGRLDLRNKAEKHLVAVWGGFFAAHLMLNASHTEAVWDVATEVSVYQTSAALAALAFFAVGTQYWGGFHVVACGFLALIPLLQYADRFCASAYGCLWAFTLLSTGIHLRRLLHQGR